MNYFNNNYYGNRAPVHIGHHFSNWMSGAYYETFFEFAKAVCSKPEVKCVTYQELVQYMNETPSSKIQKFKNGLFAKLPRPKSSIADRTFDVDMKIVEQDGAFVVKTSGQDKDLLNSKIEILLAGSRIAAQKITSEDIQKFFKQGDTVTLRAVMLNSKGSEIQSATHDIKNFATADQSFTKESIEDLAAKGHLQGAHEFEQDKNEENMEHFGH